MNRRRLLQTAVLVVGLAGIGFAVSETLKDAREHVLPSAGALVFAAVLCQFAIAASARAWVALFSDLVDSRAGRSVLRGTFYLSQLTKYLPVGGVAQAASQLGLARSVGVPLKRSTVAFPVSAVGAVVAGVTLGSGLVFDSKLPAWTRAAALCGLAVVVLLNRGLMARVLDLARHFVRRVPGSDQLPTQSDIVAFYLWALATIAALCAAYALLLHSLTAAVNPFVVFSAFAVSWVIGFVVVPIPAGVGVREAVLVALIPGVGAAPLLAASLALRLLSIGTELLAILANRVVARRYGEPPDPEPSSEVLPVRDDGSG
jgi:glycosyltransferase 2 family protein